MTKKNKAKTSARELQERVGWSYQACLNLVRDNPEKSVAELAQLARGYGERPDAKAVVMGRQR